MKKYKYVIGSVILIIIIVLILMPRSSEKIYVLFDKDEIDCTLEIEKKNFQKKSFLICNGSDFINFTKKNKEKPRFLDLDKIEKLDITSHENLLRRFNNYKFNHEKNNFDLLNRDKKFDFNLIMKHNYYNKIEIISVKQIQVLCSYKIE